MAFDEKALKKALSDYNRLYPDAKIRRLGDTPERFNILYFESSWADGKTPMHPDVIKTIELVVPDNALS